MYVGVQMRPWGQAQLERDLQDCLAEAKAAGCRLLAPGCLRGEPGNAIIRGG